MIALALLIALMICQIYVSTTRICAKLDSVAEAIERKGRA